MGKLLHVQFEASLQTCFSRCGLLPTGATVNHGDLVRMLVLGPLNL